MSKHTKGPWEIVGATKCQVRAFTSQRPIANCETPGNTWPQDRANACLIVKAPVRDQVHLRDGYRCFFPGCRRRAIDPAHIRPRSLLGPYTTRNIVSSCRQHHNWWHAGLITVSGNPNSKRGVKVQLTSLGRDAGLRIPKVA